MLKYTYISSEKKKLGGCKVHQIPQKWALKQPIKKEKKKTLNTLVKKKMLKGTNYFREFLHVYQNYQYCMWKFSDVEFQF